MAYYADLLLNIFESYDQLNHSLSIRIKLCASNFNDEIIFSEMVNAQFISKQPRLIWLKHIVIFYIFITFDSYF